MTNVFGEEYAHAYDLLYAEKDYDAECDMLEAAFRASGRPVHSVLDLGCGTGAHSIRLAQRHYEVVGVDRSVEMLSGARERAEQADVTTVDWIEGDVRTVQAHRSFDAVICMFAVLGYQTSDGDVAATLDIVRQHLQPGGSFVFDVWYGPAVESTRPERRVRVLPTEDGEIERQASAALDSEAHLCTVSYRLIARRPGSPDQITEEDHRMRYFFADELQRLVREAGMTLLDLRPFPELEGDLTTETWNVIATVRG